MDALVSAIREFDRQMFSPKLKWIVGLSGGLDSDITSARWFMRWARAGGRLQHGQPVQQP